MLLFSDLLPSLPLGLVESGGRGRGGEERGGEVYYIERPSLSI